ncbi:GNAT family N-acetyltransferase [Streptomyces rugosispiralis]|uniref:GNAT family N-acetyltransferase n=1 Tax=Streptomyces rugosispiralis TaxID=2967341 RepID=A0ABT1VCV0_9ACTN|nr:GNAT family N-acetyltransferase [Streptomyces rugosispiralis]MCQ8194773.1 GNAT family N-acetyltransferase [Streptomyces rugosispiralis]
MPQAILHTERVHLVPLSAEHLEYQVELDSDPEVMRYLGGALTRQQVEKELHEALADADRAAGLGYWAGFVEGHFAGYWILRPPGPIDQEPAEGQGELGYRLLRCHWRQGLGSEGSRELIRHGFEDLGLTRICAMTAADNTASRATMAAAGLQHVHDFRADPSDFPPGTDLRAVEYAIVREQWKGPNGRRW